MPEGGNSLSWDEAQKILKLLEETELTEIRIEIGDLKLFATKSQNSSQPSWSAQPPATHASSVAPQAAPQRRDEPPAPQQPEEFPPHLVVIRAPMLGTFYRAPSPGAEPFANENARVRANDTIFLIEVMKLYNSVPAGVDGKVVRFLVEDNALVEYNQPVVLIDPTASEETNV